MKALISIPDRPARRNNHFARAAFAMAQAAVNHGEPKDFLRADDSGARQLLDRGVAVPGSTTGAGWGAELMQDGFGGFLTSLAAYSGAARLIAQALQVSLRPVEDTLYPVRSDNPVPPTFVLENGAIPVRSGVFQQITLPPARKMAHIMAWSREVGKRPDAEAIFNQLLREDVAAGIDAAFFATTAASAAAPAGLLNDVVAGTGYSGGDRGAIDADLTGLSDAVASGNGSVTFVVAPKRLARLRIKAPDLVPVLDIVASAAVPADRIVAVDGASLLVSIDDAPDIHKADHATLHMSDTPLEIVSHTGPTTADPVRSLWQTDSVGIRVIHELQFVKRRGDAAAYLDGATW